MMHKSPIPSQQNGTNSTRESPTNYISSHISSSISGQSQLNTDESNHGTTSIDSDSIDQNWKQLHNQSDT